jgi:hypothetical protein
MTLTGKGSPNRGKFCSQPGTLPKTSDLPIQPSLAEQLGLPAVKQSLTTESMAELFPQLPADATIAERLERDERMLAWSNGGSE